MRNLVYELVDGTTVNTYAEAIASKLPYETVFKKIDDRTPPTQKRAELLKTFGVVRPAPRKK